MSCRQQAQFNCVPANLLSVHEASVHAMRAAFDSPHAEAVLQVDATNSFNCLNRQTALRNISIICPSFARILINTYLVNSLLYIDGDYILSQVGGSFGYANVCSWCCAPHMATGWD